MRIFATACSVAFFGYAVAVAPAQFAQAASCPANSLCQYSGAGYSGELKIVTLNQNYHNFCGDTMPGGTRSVINNTNEQLQFTGVPNCGGGPPSKYVSPGESVDLGFAAQSVAWCPDC